MDLPVGSQWIDTKARDVPHSAISRSTGDGPYQRIITIANNPVGIFVAVVAAWQQEQHGQWETLTERRMDVQVSSFGDGKKYQSIS